MAKRVGDTLVEEQVEADIKSTMLVSQLNDLASKIFEFENQCKHQGRYIPPHERKKSRDNQKSCVEDTFQIILQKITDQDHVQDKMRECGRYESIDWILFQINRTRNIIPDV